MRSRICAFSVVTLGAIWQCNSAPQAMANGYVCEAYASGHRYYNKAFSSEAETGEVSAAFARFIQNKYNSSVTQVSCGHMEELSDAENSLENHISDGSIATGWVYLGPSASQPKSTSGTSEAQKAPLTAASPSGGKPAASSGARSGLCYGTVAVCKRPECTQYTIPVPGPSMYNACMSR